MVVIVELQRRGWNEERAGIVDRYLGVVGAPLLSAGSFDIGESATLRLYTLDPALHPEIESEMKWLRKQVRANVDSTALVWFTR